MNGGDLEANKWLLDFFGCIITLFNIFQLFEIIMKRISKYGVYEFEIEQFLVKEYLFNTDFCIERDNQDTKIIK